MMTNLFGQEVDPISLNFGCKDSQPFETFVNVYDSGVLLDQYVLTFDATNTVTSVTSLNNTGALDFSLAFQALADPSGNTQSYFLQPVFYNASVGATTYCHYGNYRCGSFIQAYPISCNEIPQAVPDCISSADVYFIEDGVVEGNVWATGENCTVQIIAEFIDEANNVVLSSITETVPYLGSYTITGLGGTASPSGFTVDYSLVEPTATKVHTSVLISCDDCPLHLATGNGPGTIPTGGEVVDYTVIKQTDTLMIGGIMKRVMCTSLVAASVVVSTSCDTLDIDCDPICFKDESSCTLYWVNGQSNAAVGLNNEFENCIDNLYEGNCSDEQKPYYVNTAVSGSAIFRYLPDGAFFAAQNTALLAELANMEANGCTDIRLVGVWFQGEGDTVSPNDLEYYNNINTYYDYYSSYFGEYDFHVFEVHRTPSDPVAVDNVNQGLLDFSNINPNVYFHNVPDSYIGSDGIHITPAAEKLLSEEVLQQSCSSGCGTPIVVPDSFDPLNQLPDTEYTQWREVIGGVVPTSSLGVKSNDITDITGRDGGVALYNNGDAKVFLNPNNSVCTNGGGRSQFEGELYVEDNIEGVDNSFLRVTADNSCIGTDNISLVQAKSQATECDTYAEFYSNNADEEIRSTTDEGMGYYRNSLNVDNRDNRFGDFNASLQDNGVLFVAATASYNTANRETHMHIKFSRTRDGGCTDVVYGEALLGGKMKIISSNLTGGLVRDLVAQEVTFGTEINASSVVGIPAGGEFVNNLPAGVTHSWYQSSDGFPVLLLDFSGRIDLRDTTVHIQMWSWNTRFSYVKDVVANTGTQI